MSRLIIRPLQRFLDTEASGGILLLGATILALAWANSPWRESYERLWQTELSVGVGRWLLSLDLRHWVGEGLMALFFFVVGLEIKRELVRGELRGRRAAALPVVAALGGMVVPALLYATFNADGPGARGWGIPMATDIAFAVGVLALLGRRVPASLKVFLLALAIVDDIGAILIIAVFYSGEVNGVALGLAAGAVGAVLFLRRLNVRWTALYVALGLCAWLAMVHSGVHATIAGVALGLLTPATPFRRPVTEREEDPNSMSPLALREEARDSMSPLARLESLLHPWTSFLIVPLFALANVGIRFDGAALQADLLGSIGAGVIVGLLVGKPLGVVLAVWLATRARMAPLPPGASWRQVVGVGVVAGIGFTVSLFITGLAIADPSAQAAAKVGILAASVLAGGIGLAILWRTAAAPATAADVS